MDILLLLIPMSMILVFLIGGVFWWALSHKQFDNLEEQGRRILEDRD